VWHNGQTGGSHGFIALDQVRHTAVVVLSNSVSSIDDIGVHLLDARVELPAAEERPELVLLLGCGSERGHGRPVARPDAHHGQDQPSLAAT
jgi:hypothetical protein